MRRKIFTKTPEAKPMETPVKKVEVMTLNQYLSKYNRKRVLDNVIRQWYSKIDNMNPSKSKEQWDKIINDFYNEKDI